MLERMTGLTDCAALKEARDRSAVSVGAVSYTHLDVYKRQINRGLITSCLRNIVPA